MVWRKLIPIFREMFTILVYNCSYIDLWNMEEYMSEVNVLAKKGIKWIAIKKNYFIPKGIRKH